MMRCCMTRLIWDQGIHITRQDEIEMSMSWMREISISQDRMRLRCPCHGWDQDFHVVRQDETESSISRDRMRLDEIEMSMSWMSKTSISRERMKLRCPCHGWDQDFHVTRQDETESSVSWDGWGWCGRRAGNWIDGSIDRLIYWIVRSTCQIHLPNLYLHIALSKSGQW